MHLDLRVPALPRVAFARTNVDREREDLVFDAWGWCASDLLEWRRPDEPDGRGLDTSLAIDAQNPADLVFVFRDAADSTFLPRELARFHAKGYGLRDEWALAPYAIDDATDLLYEH